MHMDLQEKLFEMVSETNRKVDATNEKLSNHIADEASTHAQILGELKLLNQTRAQTAADLDAHVNLHKKWERRAYYMLVTFLLFAAERAWALLHK